MQSLDGTPKRRPKPLRSLFFILISQFVWNFPALFISLLLGRHSSHHLSAFSAATSCWSLFSLLIAGVLSNALPLIARWRHASQSRAREVAWQFFWITLFLAIAGFGTFPCQRWVLRTFAGRDDQLFKLALVYLNPLRWGIPTFALLQFLKAVAEGCDQWGASSLIGAFGLIFQTGWSTLAVARASEGSGEQLLRHLGEIQVWSTGAMALATLLLIVRRRKSLKAQLGERIFIPMAPSFKGLTSQLSLASFAGLAQLTESLAFHLLGLSLLRYGGETAMAAHQIVYNISLILYQVPNALGTRCTIQWSRILGRGASRALLHRRWRQDLKQATLLGLVNGLILLAGMRRLPYVFTQDPKVVGMCYQLIPFCIAYQIPDVILIVGAAALRSYQEMPFLFFAQMGVYWCFTVPLGLSLLQWSNHGAEGVWMAIAFSIFLSAWLNHRRIQKRIGATPFQEQANVSF